MFNLPRADSLCILQHFRIIPCNLVRSHKKWEEADISPLDNLVALILFMAGFGQANSSVLSQLAASGKVKKIFSHCLDSIHGGGIFSIGEVLEPKFNKTPLLSGQYVHYLSFCSMR
ncbi:hypothetical protein K1719_022977 [Acacia pycnantha]|nr:hypothetical protein K1719_022977 [Acacia pycnantha]